MPEKATKNHETHNGDSFQGRHHFPADRWPTVRDGHQRRPTPVYRDRHLRVPDQLLPRAGRTWARAPCHRIRIGNFSPPGKPTGRTHRPGNTAETGRGHSAVIHTRKGRYRGRFRDARFRQARPSAPRHHRRRCRYRRCCRQSADKGVRPTFPRPAVPDADHHYIRIRPGRGKM